MSSLIAGSGSMEFFQLTDNLSLGRDKKQGMSGFYGYELNQNLLKWKAEQKLVLCGTGDIDYLLKELEKIFIKERLLFALWGDLINNPQPSIGPFGLKVQCLKWQNETWSISEIPLGSVFCKDVVIPLKAAKATVEELFLSRSLQYHC